MRLKLLSGLLAFACSWSAQADKGEDPFSIYPFEIPQQYQKQLKNYRTSWTRLTGFEHSGLHWQQFITVFVNKDADVYSNNYQEYLRYFQDSDEDEDEEDIAEPKFKTYSPGTVVMKENFLSKDGIPSSALTLTFMIKREPGYDPENGDWEYVQSAKDGQIILAGNAKDPTVKQVCANCHVNIADRDYIFANFFSKRAK